MSQSTRGFQEEEKEIKIKLPGTNLMSYLDIAQKQASSSIIVEQDELEIDQNNINKLVALQQAQLQNRSFQKQNQADSFTDIQDYQHLFHYVAIVAWIFEMVLQMNTATYHEGDFITDRKTIFRIYVKEYFFFEVLPLVFEGKTSSNPTINILLHLPLLLKLKGMSIILSKLEFLILQHLHTPYVMQICKQLLAILLLVHLMACSYATLANFERNILLNQENWIDLGNIQNSGYCWWTVYIEAQLWAFYTLSNSYSSSIFSKYEYIFTSFWMLISYVVFAYNIITLGKIFKDINSAKENYQKDLNSLNRYMKRKKIDLELQRAINSHVVKQYDQEASIQFEAEKDALKKLSPHMKNKLILESNKRIISQFSIFKNLSSQTINNLYQIMEEEFYSEGQDVQIFDKNTQEYFIYLIFSGKVEILQQIEGIQKNLSGQNNEQIDLKKNQLNSFILKYRTKHENIQDKNSTVQQFQKSICFLKEGQLLGEYEFFSNTCFPYVIRCQQKTVLVKISNIKFQQIIQQNHFDLQKLMELKSKIVFNKEIELLKKECFVCKEIDHHFVSCPQTHLFKSVYFIATKSNYSQYQERCFRQRRLKKNQRLAISMPSQQVISSDDDEEDVQLEANPQYSQLCPQLEEETSILEQPSNKKFNSNKINNSKSKYIKEDAKSEYSDSQDQDSSIGQGDKTLEQAKNVPPSINNQRQNYKSRISLIKQQRKSVEKFEDYTTNQDKMDLIQKKSINEERSLTLNIDEKILNMSTSQKNLTELSQSSTLQPSNSLKRDKSLSSVTSQQIIIKQSQFQHLSQLESIREREIDSQNAIQDQNKKYEKSQEFIFIGNSLVPLNTIQSGRLSLNKNPEQCCSQQKINSQFSKKPWNGSSLYWAFDKIATFIYFFPQFNYRNVLKTSKFLKDKKNTAKFFKKQII